MAAEVLTAMSWIAHGAKHQKPALVWTNWPLAVVGAVPSSRQRIGAVSTVMKATAAFFGTVSATAAPDVTASAICDPATGIIAPCLVAFTGWGAGMQLSGSVHCLYTDKERVASAYSCGLANRSMPRAPMSRGLTPGGSPTAD